MGAQGFQLALGYAASIVQLSEPGSQLVEGYQVGGGHLLVPSPLTVRFCQLVQPSFLLLIRVAAHAIALQFDHLVQVGA